MNITFTKQNIVFRKKRGNVRIPQYEALSFNHCCRGKAVNITYSECMSVALFIQHVTHMRRFVGVWLYKVFPHSFMNNKTFGKSY